MTTKDDSFRALASQMLSEGGLALIPEYLERVQSDGDLEDMRKAVELILKANGMFGNEKSENLPVINWNINGGNVTVEITGPAQSTLTPAATEMVEVLEAQVKDAPSLPSTAAPPGEALEVGFDLSKIDEMLGALE